MGQFKKGDEIEVTEREPSLGIDNQVGRRYILDRVDDDNTVRVYFEEVGRHGWYGFNQIKLIEQSQTSLSEEEEDDKSWAYTNEEEEVDKVNPLHYKKGSVECIDAIKAATVGKSGFEGYMVGNIIKYVFRYEDKGGVEDLKKASWYLNKLIDERAI